MHGAVSAAADEKPDDPVRFVLIGCGGRGKIDAYNLIDQGGQCVGLCDVKDSERAKINDFLDQHHNTGELPGHKYPEGVFDRDDVDAVIIATPDHWHAALTIQACQAGKDVYVEKPASHSIWEGRKMVEAVRKYDRIVQVGTQQRSDPALITLRELIQKEELGKLEWVHSLWFADRGPIGKVDGPQEVPEHIEYSLWCGPRKTVPLMRKSFHYDWHWFWSYGNGDMGNRVIHNIDDVHHVLQLGENIPTEMMAVGGRFKYDDDANTPNTEFIVMKGPVPIIFSSRNMNMVHPKSGEIRDATAAYHRFGKSHRFANIVKCEGGFFAVRRGGGDMFDNDGKRIRGIDGDGGSGHMQNWVDACHSRRTADLNADVLGGHRSAVMLHTGNISYRIGRPASPSSIRESVRGIAEAEETWEQTAYHLRGHGVDLGGSEKATLGPWLKFDRNSERFTGDHAEQANAHLREDYRGPFTIADRV